jgi:putative membrane protein
MKKILLTTAAIISLPVLAIAQTNIGAAMSGASSSSTPPSAMAASKLSAQDKIFIQKAAYSGLAEVTDGKLAESRGNASVKQIGMRMVTDHSKANDQLTTLSQEFGDPAPSMTDATHQEITASLQKLSGSSFDTQYLHEQLLGHEQAITLFKTEASAGSNKQLKTFATNTLPILEMHLSMIKSAMKSTNT